MAEFNLDRAGRKKQVVMYFALRIQRGHRNELTMYSIAKGIGLEPSTHLMTMLDEMVSESTLSFRRVRIPGRWETKIFTLRAGLDLDDSKRVTRKVSITKRGKAVGQIDLL